MTSSSYANHHLKNPGNTVQAFRGPIAVLYSQLADIKKDGQISMICLVYHSTVLYNYYFPLILLDAEQFQVFFYKDPFFDNYDCELVDASQHRVFLAHLSGSCKPCISISITMSIKIQVVLDTYRHGPSITQTKHIRNLE